jgi:hypothetical protein
MLCAQRAIWISLVLGLALAGTGCNRYDGPPLYPVTGTVTLDGKPLPGAGVMFVPRGETRGNASLGLTDVNGKYTLKAEQGGYPGVPEGEFAVVISKLKDSAPAGEELAAAQTSNEETLSAKYWDSAQSILTAKVPQGGATVDFPLVSNP